MNLPQGEKIQGDKVIGCTKDPNGDTVVKYNDNRLFNSMLYYVEFSDGEIKGNNINFIDKNMYTQVDSEVYAHNTMESILDYKKDAFAVDKENMHVTTKSGQHCIWKTTLVWKLLVQRKNRTEQWIPLKDLNDSNSVLVSEFESVRGIDSEPDFVWWGQFTLRKRDSIISV